jgi:thioester reductase-like protein
LIRGESPESSKERLVKKLAYLNLLDKTEMSKVSVVSGDVTENLLGLGEELYNKLASETQAIIHCAVHTSHLEMYGRGASEKTGIKAVNVDGKDSFLI